MASLDMSLDDMIKSRHNCARGRGQGRPRRGRGRGGPFGPGRMIGVPRRGLLGVNVRPSSSTIAKSFRRTNGLPLQRDLFDESFRAAGLPGIESGGKLYISNLDIGVSNADIRELFAEIGELKQYAIHFDKNGRPSGSAEVVYVKRRDAIRAHSRYNNVQLDGKPMKVVIIGDSSEVPVSARVNVVGGMRGRRTVVMMQGTGRGRDTAFVNSVSGQRNRGGGMMKGRGRNISRGGGGGGGGGRGRGGRGRGRGSWKKNNVEKSADDLDKDLENYMQT